jgi:hypothetical protein
MMSLTFVDRKTDIFTAFRALGKGRADVAFDNSFIATVGLTAAAILLIFGLATAQESVGVETGQLETANELVKYVGATYAPLVEEIGFRSTFVGLVAVIGMLRAGPRRMRVADTVVMALQSLVYPKWVRERLERGTGSDFLRGWLVGGVFLSAAIFGAYHFILGGGWELGKITLAFLAGVFLGFIFIEYGLPAAILSHWTFNYLTLTSNLLGQIYGLPILVFELSLLFLGGLTLLRMGGQLIDRLRDGKASSPRIPDLPEDAPLPPSSVSSKRTRLKRA